MGGHNSITIKTDNQIIRKEGGKKNIWSHKRIRLKNEKKQGDKE